MIATTLKKYSIKPSAILIAYLSLSTPGTVFAISGEPLAFDQFTAANGTITAACDAWVNGNGDAITPTCGIETISDGMLQREVQINSADPDFNGTYIQFIMIEEGASGDAAASSFSTARGSLYFTGEDFVKMNNRGDGIASKQTIIQSKFDDTTFVEDRFDVTTEFKMGWANGTGSFNPWVDILQQESLIQYDNTKLLATTATEFFDETVSIKSVDGVGFTNSKIEIDQRMDLTDDTTGTANISQKFKHARAGGFYVDVGSDAFGGLINGNPILPGGTNGGVLDWNAFEEVAATWVGFIYTDPNSAIDVIFGNTRFENLSAVTGNILTSLVSLDTAEAMGGGGGVWEDTIVQSGDPMFGYVEAMADITAIIMTDFTVMDPVKLMGAANLNYIANSDPTLPAVVSDAFNPVDADYNNWTVAGGVFSGVTCPVFADYCMPPTINEQGLYQQTVVVAGVRYFHTIMVGDENATGDPTLANFAVNSIGFTNETYVKATNGVGDGIASRLHIAERGTNTGYIPQSTLFTDMPEDAGDFITDVRMNSGWANRGSVDIGGGIFEPDAVIAINQSLFVLDNLAIGAVSLDEQFSLERGATEADVRMSNFSRIGTREGALGFVEPIHFKTVTVTGAYQNTESLAGDPFTMVADGTLGTPTGSSLTWAAGDALKATWMGGVYASDQPLTLNTIGTTGFTNLTSSERAFYTTTIAPPNPDASWGTVVDPFGPAPTYPP